MCFIQSQSKPKSGRVKLSPLHTCDYSRRFRPFSATIVASVDRALMNLYNTRRIVPGTTATVLRARRTLKVRSAARFPRGKAMVMYLKYKRAAKTACSIVAMLIVNILENKSERNRATYYNLGAAQDFRIGAVEGPLFQVMK